jgi:DNA topoisomerase-1
VLAELGEHPTLGGPVSVRSGRYGPYVNHAKTNATLPRDLKPEDVTLERAVELLAEREGRRPSGRSTSRTRKSPAAKSPSRAKPKAPRKAKMAAE